MADIPKIFMQTWKNRDVPERWKSSPKSVKRFMPDWKYVLMTDEDNRKFVKKYFPDFLDTYDSLEYPIMKADAIRYMFLYVFGGVYMDLDIELMKPLDDLFQDNAEIYLVESGNTGSIYTNSFMASKPGCKIWLDCLKEIKKPYKYWQIGKHLKIMGSTGPLMLTRVINENKYKYDISTIPTKLVMPCSACDPKPCTKPGAYTKALEGSSWCGWDSFLYTSCACNWGKILMFFLVIIIIIVLFYF